MRLSTALFVTSICTISSLSAQTETPPVSIPPSIDLAFSVATCKPDLNPVFTAYALMESDLGLELWKNDGIRYAVSAEARYQLLSGQFVFIEGGGAAMYRRKSEDASYTGLYRAGAGYRMRLLNDPFDGSVQASVGAYWVNFSRTYYNDQLEINDAKTGMYVSLGASAGYPLLKNVSLEASLRYLIVPALELSALQTKVKPGGLAAGLGLVFSL